MKSNYIIEDKKIIELNLNDPENEISFDVTGNNELDLLIISERADNKSDIVINQGKNSIMNLIFLGISPNEKVNLTINLNDSKASVYIKSVNISDAFHQDFSVNIIHHSKDTKSDVYSVSIGKNGGKVKNDSVVTIKKGAKNSDSYQKIIGSVLDDKSRIEADPILLIDEFDCIAGHGTAVGKLDEEAIFYLMSRGLPVDDAKKILLNSMIFPVINKIKDENLKSKIVDKI